MSGADPKIEDLAAVRMEEVFKDVFFDFQEDNSDTLAREAYIALVDLYLRVLRDTTNWLCDDGRQGAPIGRFLADAADASETVSIITFNHDLVIENEIFRRTRLRERWCLDQAGAFSQHLQLTSPTASFPVFSTHAGGKCDHTRPISIYKLHGSLNWVVRINSIRPSTGILTNGPEGRDLYLIKKRKILVVEVPNRQRAHTLANVASHRLLFTRSTHSARLSKTSGTMPGPRSRRPTALRSLATPCLPLMSRQRSWFSVR